MIHRHKITQWVENRQKNRFWILAFYTNFCPFKIDLSGNTVSGFQKLAKVDHFGIFYELLST